MRKPNGYWNYETCYSAAKSCNSISEFTKLYPGALDKARDNAWLKDYTWFTHPEPHNKKWTKETCEIEAKKYKTLKEFRKLSASAYGVALINKWIDCYTWLERSCVKKGYWLIYENVYNEALKYKTSSEFAKKNGSAWEVARKKEWLKLFDWFKDERFDLYNGRIDSVYVYEFIDYNSAYIGRTLMRTQKERDRHHIFCNDSVSSFAKEKDIAVPEMKILEDNLTLLQGVEKEAYYIEKYRSEGWNILNKAKAGAIGSLGTNRYSYIKCYEEAIKYEYYNDFVKNSRSYYRVSYRNEWIADYTWLINTRRKHNYWNYKTCLEAAKQCKTKSEFREKYAGGFDKAVDNGWINEYTWLYKKETKPVGFWDIYENCLNESKKYSSKKELKIKNQMCYKKSVKHGWINEFFSQQKIPANS